MEDKNNRQDKLVKNEGQFVQSGSTLLIEDVSEYLLTGRFDLNPTQARISFPLILRYVQMLKDGNVAPAIHVDSGSIVNGHHRYISGCIYGKKPDHALWAKSPSTVVLDWHTIEVVIDDFGSNYDEFNKN